MKSKTLDVNWQMENFGLTKEEAETKILSIRKQKSDIAKENNKNRFDIDWQMQKFNLSELEAEIKIAKIRIALSKGGKNTNDVEWQMEKHNLTKEDAEQKINGNTKKTLDVNWQMKNFGLSKEAAEVKIIEMKKIKSDAAKERAKNRFDIDWQMKRFGLTREEVELKIAKIRNALSKAGSDRNSVDWQMKKHNLTKEEAEEKNKQSYAKGIATVNKLPEFDKKAISANNPEHWIKKGFSEEEAKEKAWNHCAAMRVKYEDKLKNNIDDYADRLNTRIEYWLKKTNGDIVEAKRLYKERQGTNTLINYVNKYGDLGFEKWKKRNKDWSLIIEEKLVGVDRQYNSIISKIESKFYKLLKEKLKNSNFTIERQFVIKNPKGSFYSYDFIVNDKIIIEFNGDFWHANPQVYESTWTNPLTQRTAEDIWKMNRLKNNLCVDLGYSLLVVWEKDFKCDSNLLVEETVNKIKEILKN